MAAYSFFWLTLFFNSLETLKTGTLREGNGTGSPGFRMDGEYDPSVRHDRRGLVSAANAGPGTDGSQFFLTFVETPWLDGKHTIYGEVVDFGAVEDGRDTLGRLEAAGSQRGTTREPLRIEKVTIEAG